MSTAPRSAAYETAFAAYRHAWCVAYARAEAEGLDDDDAATRAYAATGPFAYVADTAANARALPMIARAARVKP